MGPDGVFDVLILIEHMNSLAPLSREDLVRLGDEERERSRAKFDMLLGQFQEPGGSISSAEFMPPTAFQRDGSDNNLVEPVTVLAKNFNTFMRTGLTCPPYAAWRIAIILRRMKEAEAEISFLKAWIRHHPSRIGGRFDKLIDRFEKLEGR